jgi:hypothetical protein
MPAIPVPAGAPPVARSVLTRATVLALQRWSGNAAVTALLARAPAPASRSTPKPPDGLIGSDAPARLVAAAERLAPEWDALATPEARADVLATVALDELRELRVPAFKLELTELHQVAGQFQFATWTMQLNRGDFAGPVPDAAGIKWLTSALAHETRHCEQMFRIARLEAGRGKTPGEIAREMGLEDAEIARRAHRQPLDPASPEAAEAVIWFESIYGAGAHQRALTLANLEASDSAFKQAKRFYAQALAAYKSVMADPRRRRSNRPPQKPSATAAKTTTRRPRPST